MREREVYVVAPLDEAVAGSSVVCVEREWVVFLLLF